MEGPIPAPRRVGCFASLLRGVLGAILGLVAGGALNMCILYAGSALLPPPEGVDLGRIETINENIHRYSLVDFSVPFLAHALGTLAGAFIAASIAATPRSRLRVSIVIGCVFLLGGVEAVRMIPNAPLWFDVLDLGLAYLPMALLGWWIARSLRGAFMHHPA